MDTSTIQSTQLKLLIERDAIPSVVVPINLELTTPYSEFSGWDWDTKMEQKDSLMLVCDGATWAVADILSEEGKLLAGTTIISGDGDTVVGKHLRRVKFGKYIESDMGLVNTDFETLYIKKDRDQIDSTKTITIQEEDKMEANVGGITEDEIAKMMEAAGASAEGAGTEMDSFTQPEGETAAPTADKAVAQVRRMVESVSLSHLSKLDAFNRNHSRLLGYITANDRRVMSTVPFRVTSTDNLLPSVTDPQILDYHAQGLKSKIAGKNYPHEYVVGFRETKPGKVLSVVLEVPISGAVDISDMRSANGMVTFDDTDTTMKKINLKFEDFFSYMGFYFPNGIKESERTHGSLANDVYVETSVKKPSDSAAFKEARVLRSKTRKSNFLLPTNYFPLKVSETVDLSKPAFTEEEERGLNIAAFHSLVRPKNNNDERFNKLSKESKDLFLPESTPDNIKSRVFARSIGERVAIKVASFHNKEQLLDVVEFPMKELVPLKTEPDKFRAVFKTIDSMDKDVIARRDPRASLFSDRFAAIREVFGDEILSPEALRMITRRTGGTAARKDLLSAEDVRRLQLSGAYESANMESNIGSLKDTAGLAQRLKEQIIR